ncbi:hypothetical protein GP486_006821 [Trichoglossum hirsutum]|uniref:Nephrocystin 3-like N-terminal domain-containing protein n=1 Tax=Trichoglossum hirsutum TaxID=265104 RepID=A0A9P8IGR2_9PEZI|nr:hypothetical protein GP486_006821 [Trichoglossum hirsutum]
MEALAVVGLVRNIVQFVDFSAKLISKSTELYESSEGALQENIDTETATNHLILLNSNLKDAATSTGDRVLETLCQSCIAAAKELLAALDKIKSKGENGRRESMRKALLSVWNKKDIEKLERRLAKIKEELNLHIVVDIRKQVSQFKLEQSRSLEDLSQTAKEIIDAIVQKQDVFREDHCEIIQRGLPNAAEAVFNSFERQHDPQCLPNTRVDILNEIREWADERHERHIFWLSGFAGTGKSTIARTIAREYYEQERLGASFFFSRGGGDVGHARKFVSSIALQLAYKSSFLRSCVCKAIEEHSGITSQALRDQWNQLVLRPLSKLNNTTYPSPLILVVDALDECDGDDDVKRILQLFSEAGSLKTVQLRIFVTSRPEIPIRHGFYHVPGAKHQDYILHNISPSIVDHDITIYFEYNFRIIRQERSLAGDWPGQQDIKCLVRNAGGLFIWAATAYRYISDGRYPARRLSTILQEGGSFTAPEKQLNKIYITVLKGSIDQDDDDQEAEELYDMLKVILGSLVILYSSLSTVSLAGLLHIPEVEVYQTLERLHAILDVPREQGGSVRLHHPSFRDFLLDKQRCSDENFWVDEKKAHGTLANNCIQFMSGKLRKDICGLHAPGALAKELKRDRIELYLPAELQYACQYWVQHFQKSEARLHDNGQIHIFLRQHLLHWFETLSLIGKISDGVTMVGTLESMLTVSGSINILCSSDLRLM